jgi:hypothetical protein
MMLKLRMLKSKNVLKGKRHLQFKKLTNLVLLKLRVLKLVVLKSKRCVKDEFKDSCR